MLTNLLLLILEAVTGFFVFLLLIRFYMQWLRVSFRNQLGQFVVTVTDWLVRPARRIVPGLFGLDMPSLAGALVLHSSYLTIAFWLKRFSFGAHAGIAIPVILAVALLELVRFSVFLIIGIVLVSAVLSWVNPHAPLAPMFNSLARPFLRPFRRMIPPIANVDLSPLVLLLLLQVVLMLLAWLRTLLIPMIA
ncbi:MAG: YggT family protein [Rhodocyclaceae bacterium]|nr:YggT family protein [Rhodocyclaceae bacterium]MCP5296321.1 YggT family protein [Zoogloeaceae bacterium]MCW5595691.1 YggT family protein [Rhodocyclaceae bacterium]PKO68806.1 MAG: YggT family protein [Betaproteobacteria bacterium HGW-Betaproteobacteria-14]